VRHRRGNSRYRWLRWLLLLLLLSPFCVYAALPFLSARPTLHRYIEDQLRTAANLDILISHMRVGYDLSAELDAVSIATPGGAPFLTAERIRAAPHLPGLARGEAAEIRVEGVHLYMDGLPAQAPKTTEVTQLPSGIALAASLRGQRIELIDGFVHFGAATDIILGPLTLAVDSLDMGDGLQLSGAAALGGSGSQALWSAELGASLATSSASIRADAPIDAVLGAYSDLVLPEPLQDLEGALAVDLRGSENGRIAFDLEADIRPPRKAKPVPVRGSGEIDLAANTIAAKLTTQGLEFQSADSTRAASGLQVNLEITALRQDSGADRFDFVVGLPTGELLWERYYVDLGHHPLTVKGRLEPNPGVLKLSRAAVSAGKIGSLKGGGTYALANGRAQWQVDFDIPGLRALYQLAVRDPFADARPMLAGIDVEGRAIGSVSQATDARGARRLTGTLDLAGAGINVAEPRVRLRGIDLRLPLDFNESEPAATQTQSGWLQIAQLSAGDVDIGRVALPLAIATNRIGLAEPVHIALFGGSLDLVTLQGEALASDSPRVTLGLSLRDLDLEPLALATGLPRIVGRVTGAMPNLVLEGETITSEGEIQIDVFAGTVRLRELSVDDLSSPVPALRLDVDFSDISLKRLTSTFEVGRISGILAGRVEDLVLVDGQPVSFVAQVATVPRSGVSQRISVRAIRQISILGGSGGDPLSQSVLGLFDEYRYAKMGFRCSLENDRFVLRGVEESGDKEYLVKGATLPPRVSVVSHTRVIAFSELMRRLARVASVEDDEAPIREPAADTGDDEQEP